jgi:predicted RNA binding protein YcfA (HicA-like mRNA interferase family)
MPEIPLISGDEAIKVFMILGFQQARQKGSHVVMRRGEKGCVIPRHKELAVVNNFGDITYVANRSTIVEPSHNAT